MAKLRCALRHYPLATPWAVAVTGLCIFNFGRGWNWW